MTAPTPRKPMSPARRHHIFSENSVAHNQAPCCVCGGLVHRWRDRWIAEHVRPLALLGPDLNTNCAVSHYECALGKTAKEARAVAKAKRQARTREKGKWPSRGFWRPANAVFDWQRGRYVWDN